MHDLLVCYWAFVWMWLDHSVSVEFKRRKLVKLLCKIAYEHTDRITLERVSLIWEEWGWVWLCYSLAVECNRYLEGDMSI